MSSKKSSTNISVVPAADLPPPVFNHSQGTLLEGAQAVGDLISRIAAIDNAAVIGSSNDEREFYAFVGRLVDRYIGLALEGERTQLRASNEFRRGFFLALGKLLVLSADGCGDPGRAWDPTKDHAIGELFKTTEGREVEMHHA